MRARRRKVAGVELADILERTVQMGRDLLGESGDLVPQVIGFAGLDPVGTSLVLGSATPRELADRFARLEKVTAVVYLGLAESPDEGRRALFAEAVERAAPLEHLQVFVPLEGEAEGYRVRAEESHLGEVFLG